MLCWSSSLHVRSHGALPKCHPSTTLRLGIAPSTSGFYVSSSAPARGALGPPLLSACAASPAHASATYPRRPS